MTTPQERTRSLRQARELVDLILNTPVLPDEIRLMAQGVDRHFPRIDEVEHFARWAQHCEDRGFGRFLMPEGGS